ncbi:MAG: hypothetical protein Q9222_000776 [Ikaeria aurantiellina]
MATTPGLPDVKQASVAVNHRDSEAGPFLETPIPPMLPKWPRILGAILNVLILAASISIIGILAHSLANYSGTRGIHFGGVAISWPTDLDLHPAYFFISVSAMSLAPNLVSTIISLRRRQALSYSVMEKVFLSISGVLLVLWIVADVLQGTSERTPKTDLLSWACRRRESDTNVLVRYTSICDEQRAVKWLAVIITIAECGSLACSVVTWCFIKRWARLLDQPWRVKA